MASEDRGVRKPLLSPQPLDLTTQPRRDGPKRKVFRRCKSTPMVDNLPNTYLDPDPNEPDNARVGALFGRLIHPNLTKVLALLALYLGTGTICFYLAREQLRGIKTVGAIDAVYFCIVTMTTVGYGDLVPSTSAAKLLACGFVFTGMAIVCLTLSKAADYLVEKQEILLVRALHLGKRAGPGGEHEILREAEINRTRYKCAVSCAALFLLVIAGCVFLMSVEGMGAIDAFYCVCSTITTLGYGDMSFETKWGRVFAVVWILIGTVTLAQTFLYAAELNTEKRQRELVRLVLTRRVTNVDLEEADLDNDGNVDAAEFVLYKLKEMGKITQEDISLVIEEFEGLDVDQSGTLSSSDIFLAQSTQTDSR